MHALARSLARSLLCNTDRSSICAALQCARNFAERAAARSAAGLIVCAVRVRYYFRINSNSKKDLRALPSRLTLRFQAPGRGSNFSVNRTKIMLVSLFLFFFFFLLFFYISILDETMMEKRTFFQSLNVLFILLITFCESNSVESSFALC